MTMYKERNKVYIYIANISGLPDPIEAPQLAAQVFAYRRETMLRCMQAEKRRQSLAAGLLLRHVLDQWNISEADICIGEHGKPEIHSMQKQESHLHFNLSHAGEWVLCAVSDKPVGCDIEKITVEPANIAKRFFCASENEHLSHVDGEERTYEFFRLWTLKESYIKMTGEGLSLPLNQIEFIFEADNSVKVYRKGALCHCHLKEYDVPQYHISICAENSNFSEQIEFINLKENNINIKKMSVNYTA